MNTWRCFSLFAIYTTLMLAECMELLQYSPISITCSGPCCLECLRDPNLDPSNDNVTLQGLSGKSDSCDEPACLLEHIDHRADSAIDNDLQTLWNSSAVYSNFELTMMGLTVDLSEVCPYRY